MASSPCPAVFADLPETVLWDRAALAGAKAAWKAGDAAFVTDVRIIVKEADAELSRQPGSVVITKSGRSLPGIDPHDYFSTAPYWWPNPAAPDGLPYVWRDGRKNPDFFDGDYRALSGLATAVRRLSLAWWLTGDDRYATHAALLLRTWFLAPETRMNPHMRHAQAIRGVSEGRAIGLVDAVRFLELIDGVQLLKTSSALAPSDYEGIRSWFSEFLTWCLDGDFGRELAARKNNIATWYYAQIGVYAAFTGREQEVRALYETNLPALAAGQIEPDGRQPEELSRTQSMHYSAFNLLAWESIATLGKRIGMDCWNPGGPVGERIHAAMHYLATYASPSSVWPHPELDSRPPARDQLTLLLIRARAANGGRADAVIDGALAELCAAFPASAWVRVAYGFTPQP